MKCITNIKRVALAGLMALILGVVSTPASFAGELKAAGIDNGRTSPMVLPDYRFKVG